MDDLIDLDGLTGPADSLLQDLMAVGIGGTSGAAALTLNSVLVANMPWVKDRAWARALAHVALSATEGILVARYVHRSVGAGIAFGGSAFGIVKAVGTVMPSVYQGTDLDGLDGLGAGLDDDDLLLGLGATSTREAGDNVLASLGQGETRSVNNVAGIREASRAAGVGAFR